MLQLAGKWNHTRSPAIEDVMCWHLPGFFAASSSELYLGVAVLWSNKRKKILKQTGTHVSADILSDCMKASAFGEIVVDLSVPRRVLAFAHKRGELRELRPARARPLRF
jgi:hypothetical protein